TGLCESAAIAAIATAARTRTCRVMCTSSRVDRETGADSIHGGHGKKSLLKRDVFGRLLSAASVREVPLRRSPLIQFRLEEVPDAKTLFVDSDERVDRRRMDRQRARAD